MWTKSKTSTMAQRVGAWTLRCKGVALSRPLGSRQGSLWGPLPSAGLALDLLPFRCILPEESRHAWPTMLIPFLCLIINPLSCSAVHRPMGLGADTSTSSGQRLSLGVDVGSMYTCTEAVGCGAGLRASCELESPDQIHLE